MTLRIAIVTDEPGWHGCKLRQAFAARGAQSRTVSLTDAQIRLDDRTTLCLEGFENRLPDAVFVRGVPGGSLEEIVFYLNVLHGLHDLGVVVYNDGRAIERSVDKSLTSMRLQMAGLPVPTTWICRDQAQAQTVAREHARAESPLICKPLFGSQGIGIQRVESEENLPSADEVNHVWYLQTFVGADLQHACDWRVFVVGGKAVAAMRRTAPGWLANVAQGGSCHAALPEGEPARLAEAAVQCLDMSYAGVDLIQDASGTWWVIEVNSIPAWYGLQKTTHIDIAGLLADDLLARCAATCRNGVAQ